MRQHIRMNWLCLLAILLTGCRSSEYLQSIDKPDWHWTVSDDVRSAWLEHRSYYALIEIIDTELVLHGNQIDHHPTRKDVETALGKGHQPLHYLEWEDIDTCPVWQYSSRRKVSSGSYVSFRFNENDRVVEMQWYSE